MGEINYTEERQLSTDHKIICSDKTVYSSDIPKDIVFDGHTFSTVCHLLDPGTFRVWRPNNVYIMMQLHGPGIFKKSLYSTHSSYLAALSLYLGDIINRTEYTQYSYNGDIWSYQDIFSIRPVDQRVTLEDSYFHALIRDHVLKKDVVIICIDSSKHDDLLKILDMLDILHDN